MGQTVQALAKKELSGKPIFPNRFVIEICEKVHIHYKNLRIVNNIHDFVSIAEGFRDSLDRWKKRGAPGVSKKNHIELCRKEVISETFSNDILINLNKNLYPDHEGRVFSEGAEFDEPYYIHFKVGDARVELSIDQFKEVCDAVKTAEKELQSSDIDSMLQKT